MKQNITMAAVVALNESMLAMSVDLECPRLHNTYNDGVVAVCSSGVSGLLMVMAAHAFGAVFCVALLFLALNTANMFRPHQYVSLAVGVGRNL
jgi:hypothetical protein